MSVIMDTLPCLAYLSIVLLRNCVSDQHLLCHIPQFKSPLSSHSINTNLSRMWDSSSELQSYSGYTKILSQTCSEKRELFGCPKHISVRKTSLYGAPFFSKLLSKRAIFVSLIFLSADFISRHFWSICFLCCQNKCSRYSMHFTLISLMNTMLEGLPQYVLINGDVNARMEMHGVINAFGKTHQYITCISKLFDFC